MFLNSWNSIKDDAKKGRMLVSKRAEPGMITVKGSHCWCHFSKEMRVENVVTES